MRLSTTLFLAAVGLAPLLAALSPQPARNRVADPAPMAEVTRRDEGIPAPRGGSLARVALREDRTAEKAFPSRSAVWIRGNVRDGSSQPIAAAHLEIYLERGEERELLSAVETLEDGSFSCPSPRLTEMTAIERAGIVVRGSSEGIALWEASETLPLAGDVPLDLEVDRRWASGRVLDEIGRPVAGAWIEAVAPSHPDLRETWWFARSYDDGRYGIPASGPLERIEARAERVGWGSIQDIPIDPEGATLLPDLVLREESTIEGTARYPNGAPARWVDLRATPEDGFWERAASCRTDGKGRFRFAGLEAGIHAVTLEFDPFDDSEHLVSTGDEEVDLVFDVYRVLVRVGVGGGPPLLGQEAAAYPIRRREDDTIEPIPSDSIAWFETSGPEAVAVLPVEPGRPYLVRAGNETAFPAEEIVEVPRGIHETEETLALRPVERGRLDVRLLDEAGDPVESSFVELLSRRTGMREVESWIREGDSTFVVPAGEFLLRARPEWRTASGEFLLPATATAEVLPERETRVVLRSRRGGRIDLELLDPERSLSPFERTVRVEANAAGAPERLELRFIIPAPSCGGTIDEIAREGVYRSATVLEPGTYVFSVRGKEFEAASAVAVVRPGEVTLVRVEVHRR